jgi:hypothetical protein
MSDLSRGGRGRRSAPQTPASSGGQLRPSYRRTLRAALAILAAGVGLAGIYSCSLIVDSQSQQCKQTSDCSAAFGSGSTCDTATGLCTSTSTSSTGGGSASSSSSNGSSGGSPCDVDGGIAGGGCYNSSLATCPLSTTPTILNSELLNACTTGCVPFDNSVLGLVGGQLPPLPIPGPDGGF